MKDKNDGLLVDEHAAAARRLDMALRGTVIGLSTILMALLHKGGSLDDVRLLLDAVEKVWLDEQRLAKESRS